MLDAAAVREGAHSFTSVNTSLTRRFSASATAYGRARADAGRSAQCIALALQLIDECQCPRRVVLRDEDGDIQQIGLRRR